MHDTLFENQDALEPEDLVTYAAELGLEPAQFAQELQSGAHAPRVQDDFLSGVRSGVNGTPTFFVNGVRHDDSWEEEGLILAIKDAAARARRGLTRPRTVVE